MQQLPAHIVSMLEPLESLVAKLKVAIQEQRGADIATLTNRVEDQWIHGACFDHSQLLRFVEMLTPLVTLGHQMGLHAWAIRWQVLIDLAGKIYAREKTTLPEQDLQYYQDRYRYAIPVVQLLDGKAGGVRHRDISEHLKISPSGTKNLIRRLESEGLLSVVRSGLSRLTPKGQHLAILSKDIPE